jgi:hypothetical protein
VVGIISRYPAYSKISIFLALAAVLAVGVRTYIGTRQADSCFIEQSSTSLSPDKSHEALLVEQTCAYGPIGGTYHILSVRSGNPSDKGTDIFQTDQSVPTISWLGGRHLIVTINNVSWIGLSLHQAAGIEVSYRLADRLAQENIVKEEREWEQRSLASIHPVPPGQTSVSLDSFNFAKAVQKENFEKFKAWAQANIPNAYPQQ